MLQRCARNALRCRYATTQVGREIFGRRGWRRVVVDRRTVVSAPAAIGCVSTKSETAVGGQPGPVRHSRAAHITRARARASPRRRRRRTPGRCLYNIISCIIVIILFDYDPPSGSCKR